ncbi:glycosyltransferase involved in cell wall biosynthesis [Bradyrhizobium sp. BR13661]|nr:glycosyltransferase involved in cell wall biosynthesis [Bradyrhizobium sp. BR13661]
MNERFIRRLPKLISTLKSWLLTIGSTDRTLDIVQRLARADARVRVFSIPNAGVAEARNLGLKNSSGGYVAFLDADDLWHPNKIEAQLAALNAAADAAACYVMFRATDLLDAVSANSPEDFQYFCDEVVFWHELPLTARR